MAKGQAVDQRIVEMKFDNSDFESKVGKTLETLTKLREKTKMEDAGKGMENLAKGVKEVDLSRLADGIEQLNQRFSAFGIMGQQVVRNLTDSLMGLGKQFVDAVTSAPKGGFQTYESFVSATKQLKNSAKDAEGLPVTLEAVNNALDDLNTYSDKTIYSFNDMTANIGKFTNAGVNLEDSVTAIKGISNVAASAGANAQNAAAAMYNFGQALGTGVVKLMDWRSINNANMASVDFKQNLIDTAKELGTLTEVNGKYISSTYAGKKANEDAFDASHKFEESLNQQWMTSEVLIETLRKYANELDPIGSKAYQAATEVNTFGQMMSVFAESQKTSWSKVWRYVFGDYEESKNMWTGILGELNKITANFFDELTGEENGIIRAWHDRGGYKDMIEGFKNLWTAAQHFVDPIKDLFAGLFPEITSNKLLTLTKDFRHFAETLAYPFKEAGEAVDEVKNKAEELTKPVEDVVEQAEKFKQIRDEIIQGKWGNGQERIDRLTEAGYAFENLQNGVNETLGSTKRYETVMSDAEAVGEKLTDNVKDQADEQKNYREEIKKSNDQLFVHKGAVENIAYIFLGVSSAVKTVVKVVDLAVTSFKGLSGGVGPVAATFGVILDVLGNIGRHVYNFNANLQEWMKDFNTIGDLLGKVRSKIFEFFNANKDGQRTLGVTNDRLADLRVFLNNLVTIFQNVKKGLDGLLGRFTKLGDAEFLVDLRIALNNLGTKIGQGLLVTFNAIASVFNKVIEAAGTLRDKIKGLSVVEKLINAYNEAKTAVQGFWENLIGGGGTAVEKHDKTQAFLDNLASTLTTVAGVMTSIGGKVFGWFMKRLDDLNRVTEAFFGYLKTLGITDRLKSIWESFKAVFKDLPTIIDNFFNSIKSGKLPTLSDLSTNLYEFVEKIKNLGTELKNKAGQVLESAFNNLVGSIANLGKLQLPESLRNLTERIASAFGLFGDTTTSAAKTIGDFVHNVLDKLKGIDLRQVAITGLIGSVALFVARWSKVGKNGANALKSLTTFIKNGGKAATDVQEKFSGFLKIAAAIALIAASVWLLAQVPADRFGKCVATLAIAFVALAGVVIYLTKAKMDDGRLKGIGIAFAGLGASLVLFAAAVKAFSSMVDDPNFIKGCGLVALAIVSMIAAIKMTGPVSDGAGKAFAGLAAGVLILSIAVRSFAAISPDALIKGGIAVELFMFSMAAAMKLAGNVSADGFMGLAGAIVILMIAVKSLGKMRTDKLVKGEIAVIALVVAVALASKQAKDVDGAAFKAMGQAIKIMAAALFILSKIPLLNLIAVTASLVIIFKTLTDAAKELKEIDPKESGKIAVALLAMLVPIGLCLGLLATFADPDAVLKVAVGLAAVMWALSKVAPAIEMLSHVDLAAGGKAILLLDGLLVSIAAIIGTLLYILGSISEAGGEKLVNGAHLLGEIFHALIEGFIFGDEDPNAILTSIGEGISNFATKIQDFVTALQGMDSSVAENAKNLATAILAICAAEVLEALTGWIAGKSDFSQFGQAISSVTGAIIEINKAVSGEDSKFNNRAVKQVISCVKGMVEIANELPREGGLLQKLIGHQDLGEFANQLAIFLGDGDGGFKAFYTAINGLGDLGMGFVLKVDFVRRATKAMIDLANDLPSSGLSLKSIIFGNQDLGKFAEQMAAFITNGFFLFVMAVNALPTVDVTKIKTELVPATEALIELSKKMPDDGGAISKVLGVIFGGKQDLGEFASKMADFMMNGFLQFAIALAALPVVKVDKINSEVIPATEAMMSLSEKLKDGSSILSFITGRTDLGIFGSNLADFGTGVLEFANSMKEANLTEVGGVLDSLERLAALNASDDILGNGFATFSSALTYLGAGLVAFATDTATITPEYVANVVSSLTNLHNMLLIMAATDYSGVSGFTYAIEDIVASALEIGTILADTVISTIGDFAPDFAASGTEMAEAWARGFTQDVWVEFYGMALINKVINGMAEKTEAMKTAGTDKSNEFAKGFVYEPWVEFYGMALINKVIRGIQDKYKDMKSEGGSCAMEFCAGLTVKYASLLKGAGNSVVAKALEGIDEKIGGFKTKGQNAAEGFANGMDDYTWKVEDAAEKMAQAALDKAAETIKSASPSKKFRELGHYSDEGFALGFLDKIPMVVQSVKKTGNAGILAMRNTVEKMNDMIGDEVDYTPTITPVLDLTQLNNGMATTRGLLAELNNARTGIQAAVDISTAHNEALAKAKERANRDYSGEFRELNKHLKNLNETAKKNNVAVIDGDYLFGYVNTRLGMA